MKKNEFQKLVKETLTEKSFAKWSHSEKESDTVKITARLTVNVEINGRKFTKSLGCSTLTENRHDPICNAIIAIEEEINKTRDAFLDL